MLRCLIVVSRHLLHIDALTENGFRQKDPLVQSVTETILVLVDRTHSFHATFMQASDFRPYFAPSEIPSSFLAANIGEVHYDSLAIESSNHLMCLKTKMCHASFNVCLVQFTNQETISQVACLLEMSCRCFVSCLGPIWVMGKLAASID